jgi:hypothetical protein
VAGFKSERWPASDRNRWPASYWNAWPASSESAIHGRIRFIALNAEFGNVGESAHFCDFQAKPGLGSTLTANTHIKVDTSKPTETVPHHQRPAVIVIDPITENDPDNVLVQIGPVR